MKKIKKKEKESSELEKEFAKNLKSFREKYKKKMKQISPLIEELEQLSEKYGIPFTWEGPPAENSFEPKSFKKKFGKLEEDFLYDNDVFLLSEDGAGWQYSFTMCGF